MNSLSQILGGSGPKPWVSGRVYQNGSIVQSPADNNQLYVRVTAAGSGATDPLSDTTNYKPIGGRTIKSIQRGTILVPNGANSQTATVTSVNTQRAVLHFMGSLGNTSSSSFAIAEITLTNSTTVTASLGPNVSTLAGANGVRATYQLVESY